LSVAREKRVFGTGGGLLIANMVNPQTAKQGTEMSLMERRKAPEPIPVKVGPSEPVQYLAAPSLPAPAAAAPVVLLGRHSDRTMERKGHIAVALLMAAIGIGLSGLASNPIIVMALLCFAQIGVSAVPAMFWPLPASFLTGASAAAGIAAINSLGNLSGFAGPFAMGYLKDLTGDFTVGLLLLAGCALLGAAVVVSLRIDVKREQSTGGVGLAH
jgi:ACS family tartrate transporter-like MFS transporter